MDDDRRTVRRQKGERKSDDRRTNSGDRRTVRRQNDDDKRTETRQRGVIRKFASHSKIDGVEQQIDQVGIKVNRIEKDFQKNKEEMERKLEDTKRQVQREILEKDRRTGPPIASYINSRFWRLFDLTRYSITKLNPYAC
ncbi:hypothetical protein NQ318_016802 [Aromia moschata]|uniref:Uncharacterized protein n=1 Tax=Aromia moschata TaxID=1265417 RepID=A0AAV8X9T1_9CUCU|nr:hypothetical protein NQ318_016802 [Aromia moschata]